jgi:D-arabinose 1-dehydrogenase-like Zn-dependent alcohol dehydrogenase
MQAMVLREYNRPMELTEVETPKILEDDILLKVKACGICNLSHTVSLYFPQIFICNTLIL